MVTQDAHQLCMPAAIGARANEDRRWSARTAEAEAARGRGFG